MSKSKDQTICRLRSAKEWLNRAEDSFDQERETRGELNLLLAQAELTRARETNSQAGRKYAFFINCLALMMALVIALGGWQLLTKRHTSVSQSKADAQFVQELGRQEAMKPATPQPLTRAAEVEQGYAGTREPEPSAAVLPVSAQPAASEQEIRLSPAEMQRLVRAAERSLRGQ